MNRDRFEVHNSPKFLPYFCALGFVTFRALIGLRIVKSFRFFAFLCVWASVTALAAALPVTARAQSNPPFKNPSLDSDCYFPQIGMPGEIDTIMGNQGEGLGTFIYNLGPQPDGTPGNMLIDNVKVVATGPTFNLHDLKVKATANLPDVDPQYMRFGHFRNKTSVDILEWNSWVIYWADANGNYDIKNKTKLETHVIGNGVVAGGSRFIAYISPLISDTVDDIVLGYGTNDSIESQDSMYLVLFSGGGTLAAKDTAYEDTSANFGPLNDDYYTLQGDFRGSGRDDLLIVNIQFHRVRERDVYFYGNDPPFSLQKLANAIGRDTFWTSKDNKVMKDSDYAWLLEPDNAIVMHLLPKKRGDNSVDLAAWIPTTNDSDNGIFIFRGGPTFGSHRLTIDSAVYVIIPPKTLGYEIWPGILTNAGDMTGTGKDVLYTGGGSQFSADQNYYVTGEALDSKIDIFYGGFGGLGDTLNANSDSLEDLLLGNPSFGPNGTLWLIYGSKQIPVHLNPQFVDLVNLPVQGGTALSFSPNPAQTWSVATIFWPEGEEASYEVYSLLGSIVQTGTIRMLGGAEQLRMYFPSLSSGVYEVLIHGSSHDARTKLVIVR